MLNILSISIPLLIGLLASILGLSGLADKVLGVIRKIRQRITAGITKFWNFVKEKGKGLLNKAGSVVGKKDNKTKEEKRKEKPKDKRTPAEKQKDLDRGVNEGTKLLRDDSLDKKEIQKRLEVLEDRYDLQELKIVTDKTEQDKETVHIHGKVNPEKDGEKIERRSIEKIRMLRKIITFDKIKFSSEAIRNGSPVYDEKNSDEYLKQLKVQERGINKMKAVDWLRNKFTFDEFGRQKDNNSSVRNKIKRDLQRGFDEKFREQLVDKNYSEEKI